MQIHLIELVATTNIFNIPCLQRAYDRDKFQTCVYPHIFCLLNIKLSQNRTKHKKDIPELMHLGSCKQHK